MPIHIDRMDTSIELAEPQANERVEPASEQPTAAEPPAAGALREQMMQILTDELERYARMRGH